MAKGSMNITVKCAPEKEEPEESDDMENEEPMEMAKGGMVNAPKKSIQLKGWGKARRR